MNITIFREYLKKSSSPVNNQSSFIHIISPQKALISHIIHRYSHYSITILKGSEGESDDCLMVSCMVYNIDSPKREINIVTRTRYQHLPISTHTVHTLHHTYCIAFVSYASSSSHIIKGFMTGKRHVL